MPHVKIEVKVYKRSLGYTTFRDSFMVGSSAGETIDKALFLRAIKKLLGICRKYNQYVQGKRDKRGSTTTTTTT